LIVPSANLLTDMPRLTLIYLELRPRKPIEPLRKFNIKIIPVLVLLTLNPKGSLAGTQHPSYLFTLVPRRRRGTWDAISRIMAAGAGKHQ
jgi:hypothetical protein